MPSDKKPTKKPAAAAAAPAAAKLPMRRPSYLPKASDNKLRDDIRGTSKPKTTPKRVIAFVGARRAGTSGAASVMPYALIAEWQCASPNQVKECTEDVALTGADAPESVGPMNFKQFIEHVGATVINVYDKEHVGPMQKPFIWNNGTRHDLRTKARCLLENMDVEVSCE